MCYSTQVVADYKKHVRHWRAPGMQDFYRLYWLRDQGAKVLIPKALDAAFANPLSEDEQAIKRLIDSFDTAQAMKLEQAC